MSYCVVLCRTVSYCVVLCRTVSYRVVLCRTVSYRVVPCHTVSYRVVLCRTVSYGVVAVRHLVRHSTTRRTSPTRQAPTPCTTLYDASYAPDASGPDALYDAPTRRTVHFRQHSMEPQLLASLSPHLNIPFHAHLLMESRTALFSFNAARFFKFSGVYILGFPHSWYGLTSFSSRSLLRMKSTDTSARDGLCSATSSSMGFVFFFLPEGGRGGSTLGLATAGRSWSCRAVDGGATEFASGSSFNMVAEEDYQRQMERMGLVDSVMERTPRRPCQNDAQVPKQPVALLGPVGMGSATKAQ